MSASKKKNLDAMDEGDSSSESDGDDGPNPDAYSGNEEVEIDFEGRSPSDPDFHGIAQLLSRLFLKAHVNVKQMAELIIGQNYVGSVICQCASDGDESDDDMVEEGTVFGITTVVNITAKKEKPCIEELRSYILQRAEKHATDAVLKHFRDVLGNEARHVGFLINERFINIPAPIAIPLFENLYKEIGVALQKQMKFDFAYLMMIVKFFRKEAHKGKPQEDTFTNAEEEIICSESVSSFEFSVKDECDSGVAGNWLEDDVELTPYRKVLLFDAKQLPQLISDIQNFLNGQ